VWLHHRFSLSTRDVEDLVAERGISVSDETVRTRCQKFGPNYAKRLRRRPAGFGDTFFVDEVIVKIGGTQH
jgi:putative transposase